MHLYGSVGERGCVFGRTDVIWRPRRRSRDGSAREEHRRRLVVSCRTAMRRDLHAAELGLHGSRNRVLRDRCGADVDRGGTVASSRRLGSGTEGRSVRWSSDARRSRTAESHVCTARVGGARWGRHRRHSVHLGNDRPFQGRDDLSRQSRVECEDARRGLELHTQRRSRSRVADLSRARFVRRAALRAAVRSHHSLPATLRDRQRARCARWRHRVHGCADVLHTPARIAGVSATRHFASPVDLRLRAVASGDFRRVRSSAPALRSWNDTE